MAGARIRNRGAVRLVAATVLVVATVAWSAAVVLAASAPSSVTIGSASTGLGQVLAGPNGHTLYTLSSDPNNASTCTGACTGPWPPLLVASGGTVTAAAGVSGSLTTFVRSDSSTQVADNGRALYYFVHDTAAGQTNGEGIVAFGGTWHVVKLAAATGGGSTGATPPPTDTVPGSGAPATSLPLLWLGLLVVAVGVVLAVALVRRGRAR